MQKAIFISTSKTIKQPLAKVWNAVADHFGDVANYNPAIAQSRYEGPLRQGIGTTRHCDFASQSFIKERITQWEDKSSFKLSLVESSVPLAYLESEFKFEEAEGSTIVTQHFWYRMKSPMGWLSGLMKTKMKRTLEQGLNGLNNYLTK